MFKSLLKQKPYLFALNILVSIVIVFTASFSLHVKDAEAATNYYVATNGNDLNTGTENFPFKTLAKGVSALQPGDTLLIKPGTYSETLTTVRAGTSGSPITIKSHLGRNTVTISKAGKVGSIDHAYTIIDSLTFDSQYAASDAISVSANANYLQFTENEVRKTSRDCIDMGAADNVLFEGNLIHHCLWWDSVSGRQDAHGIVANGGQISNLTIRNNEIHTFSGDAFQIDPARSTSGWLNILVENSHFWLAPFTAAENGFAAGTTPGENAIDTKSSSVSPRGSITLRNNRFHGFRDGLMSNMAAVNFKENITGTAVGNVIYDSDIAFRLRGPGSNGGAEVKILNNIVYSSASAFRYEDNINNLRIWNNTIGTGVTKVFTQAGASQTNALDLKNNLIVGSTLPAEANNSTSNKIATTAAFQNAGAHDYRLATGSLALDSGVTILGVNVDRDGVSRPQGSQYDVGAYEARSSTQQQPAAKSHIVLSPTSLSFSGKSGSAPPTAKTILLSNAGKDVLSWQGSASYNWCHITPQSGTIAVAGSASLNITVDAPSNIGDFICTLSITSTNADNSPQIASVSYNVSAPLNPAPISPLPPSSGSRGGEESNAKQTPIPAPIVNRNPQGSLINHNGILYFLGVDFRYPFPSVEVFLSWGFKFKDVIQANTGDVAMPVGPLVEMKPISTVPRHPRGTLVNQNGTIYFLGATVRYPFPSAEVFLSWGGRFQDIVPANAGDVMMPIGAFVEMKR